MLRRFFWEAKGVKRNILFLVFHCELSATPPNIPYYVNQTKGPITSRKSFLWSPLVRGHYSEAHPTETASCILAEIGSMRKASWTSQALFTPYDFRVLRMPTPRTLHQSFPGEVTLEDFVAFAQKQTWGQEPTDLLMGTGTFGTMTTLPGNIRPTTTREVSQEEEDDSDGEDARCLTFPSLCSMMGVRRDWRVEVEKGWSTPCYFATSN